MMHMTAYERDRAFAMWGISFCLLSAAAGWVFMRFGQAWSVADLPPSDYVSQIVPAYVVSEVAMIAVGGKLVDRYGCRAVLGFAPFLFVISSMLCMVSTSVEMLIVFRLLQGAGGGLILALAFSCVGKYYDGEKRGRCNELMTAMFAVGSLFGSAAGYFLTDTFNWRMGFAVFGAVALAGAVFAWRHLPQEEKHDVPVDHASMVLTALTFGIATLYTQVVNVNFDLFSVPSGIVAVIVTVLTLLLIHHSHRCSEPTIPVRTSRFEMSMVILMFMFSLCGLGLIQYFFKLYLTFYEFDIYKATMMFFALLGGAAITSISGSRLVYRTGARPWIIVGSLITAVGLALTHFIADQGVFKLGVSLFVFGIGLGCIVTQIICSLQSVVPKKDMGQHVGNLMAVRMVGILAGNAIIGSYIKNVIEEGRTLDVIDLSSGASLIDQISEHLVDGLKYVAESLDSGFLTTAAILAVIAALLSILAYTLGRDDLDALEPCDTETE